MEAPQVLIYPDPRLRVVAKEITEVTDEIKGKAIVMRNMMIKQHGIGLSATQVGWDVRLVVINLTDDPEKAVAFINPEILSKSGSVVGEEGCLSFPGLFAKVERAEKIKIRTQSLDGEEIELEMEGLPARVLQHEIDHLDGVLFIDKVTAARRLKLKKALKAYKNYYNTVRKLKKDIVVEELDDDALAKLGADLGSIEEVAEDDVITHTADAITDTVDAESDDAKDQELDDAEIESE